MQRTVITQEDIGRAVSMRGRQADVPGVPMLGAPGGTTAAVQPAVPSADDYKSKLLKYIPAETVALYLTLDNLVRSAGNQIDKPGLAWILWAIFVVGLVGTPLYLYRIGKVDKPVQLLISTVAFAVWVFALGGAFAVSFDWYLPVYGAMVLVVYTFAIPLISPD